MTGMLLNPTAAIAPDVRLRILRNFAGGATATAVAHQVGVTHDVVDAVLATVGNDRARARAVAQLERQAASTAQPADIKPAPVNPAPRVPILLDRPVEDVLADADQAGTPFGAAADRIRTAVADLAEKLAEHHRVAAAERRVQELQQQLAAATEALHALRPATAARVRRTADVDPKAVRAWAASAGVECSPYGRIKQEIVDQWRAATGGAS